MKGIVFTCLAVLACIAISVQLTFAQTDPLPSWNDGAAKRLWEAAS